MTGYFGDIWKCRYFWLSLVKMDLRNRYRGSVLGMGWSLAYPIAMTIIFTVVFSSVFKSRPGEYGLYVIIGMSCWSFMLQCALLGCLCFNQAEAYIRQHPVPAAVYPLRVSMGLMIHLLLALLVCVGFSVIVRGELSPAALATLPLSCLLMLLFGWTLSVLFGLLYVHFRDTKYLAELGFQVLFYLTPIVYKTDLMTGNRLMDWMRFNPFLPFIDLFRRPLYLGTMPTPLDYAKACLIVVMGMSLAGAALARLERRLVFHL